MKTSKFYSSNVWIASLDGDMQSHDALLVTVCLAVTVLAATSVHPCKSLCICVSAVAGLVDAFLYHSSRAIQRKIQLGKTTWHRLNSFTHSQLAMMLNSHLPCTHRQHHNSSLMRGTAVQWHRSEGSRSCSFWTDSWKFLNFPKLGISSLIFRIFRGKEKFLDDTIFPQATI